MRVDYRVGFNDFKSEWCCPEHKGYAHNKFKKWWQERAALGCPFPKTAEEAVEFASNGGLATAEAITVKTVSGERFDTITGYKLKSAGVYSQLQQRQPGEDDDGMPIMTEYEPIPNPFSASSMDNEDDIPF